MASLRHYLNVGYDSYLVRWSEVVRNERGGTVRVKDLDRNRSGRPSQTQRSPETSKHINHKPRARYLPLPLYIMATASGSNSSAQGSLRRKRKAVEMDPTPQASLRLKPSAESYSIYKDLPEGSCGEIKIVSPKEQDSPTPTDEAAAALRNNILWKAIEQHLAMKRKTACRTAIDLLILAAVDLAQKEIATKRDVDNAIRARHSLKGPNWHHPDGREVGSWVILDQHVNVPDLKILPGVALRGTLDHLLTVIPADEAESASRSGASSKAVPFLSTSNICELFTRLPSRLEQRMASAVLEAKTDERMSGERAWKDAAVQGAALCALADRASMIYTLTNGLQWRFYHIAEVPDEEFKVFKARRRASWTSPESQTSQ
ncbi:hypothetical protein C8R45DRAFT_185080 [Mycena sanguinolenta]|nr:hypothetical protein C8R45DRAFT_185080 [Mycena sanguinolenta]